MLDKNKILPIAELYYAIQAEGSRAGLPTVVVRTTGCTHRCNWGTGGWCDAWNTSIHPEKGKYTFADIEAMYEARPDIKEMMLTGGSPTMHPKLVDELTKFAYAKDVVITMETEGSHAIVTTYPIALLSISPKFSNSVPVLGISTPLGTIVDEKFIQTHNRHRLNYDTIAELIRNHCNYQIKPVVNPKKQPEIWAEVLHFLEALQIPKNKVWIMPPGDNRETLIQEYPDVIEFCTENGYNFTGREHIIAFDTKRCV